MVQPFEKKKPIFNQNAINTVNTKNWHLTHNMKITELRFCRHRIDLTHVSALVLLLHVGDVQEPRFVLVVLVVGNADARISRDDVIMHRQYGRLFEVHPCYL